jgi:hypothetical protein
MKDKQQEKPVSPQKLAANRKNAKRSTGPRTSKGKQRASQNSYKHGFFGIRLFPNHELIARDGADYKRIFRAYWSHYSPVGDVEKLYVEKIAVESLRLARVLGHEQKVFAWKNPFEQRSVDKIVRYESSVSRQLEKAIDQLERLQEAREAESNQFEPSGLESDDAFSEPDEATEKRSEAPEDLIPEQPQRISASSNAPDASLTTAPLHVEASSKQGSAQVEGEPSGRPAETATINPPPENCVPNACAQTLAKAIEQAMDPTPAEQHKSGLASRESYETDAIGSSRFVETEKDVELIERIKRGDDLEDLE